MSRRNRIGEEVVPALLSERQISMYLDGGKYSYDPTKSYLHADSRHKPWHINGASKKLQCHWGKLAWGIQDVRKTAQALLISFWDIGRSNPNRTGTMSFQDSHLSFPQWHCNFFEAPLMCQGL